MRSILTPAQKQVNSIPTLKPSQFRSRTQKPRSFRSHHCDQVNFDLHSIGRYRCPDTETGLILIQTLKTGHFRPPHNKPSLFRSLHWNQVNSDPPRWNQVYFDHLHNNQVNFEADTKTMSFSARFILRVIHTSTYMFLWYSNTYHINMPTNSCYSSLVHTK